MPRSRRHILFGLVHQGTQAAFGDDADAHRDWVYARTGHHSCRDCTDAQLDAMIRELRQQGLLTPRIERTDYPGGNGPNQPTERQWRHLAGLARSMGWDTGLVDHRLRAFVRRTAKVDAVRFMTRGQISQVINGLHAWVGQQNALP